MKIFANPNYDFIRWRWHALIFSVVLIWGGMFYAFAQHGLQLGIEFTGGTLITADFPAPVDEGVVRNAVDPISKEAVVQRLLPGNKIMIRVPNAAGHELSAEELDAQARQVVTALKNAGLAIDESRIDKKVVGAVIGHDLQQKGIWATITSLGGILIYVAFRFRFTFAVGAIVAAFHDILITFTLLAFFHYDITLNVIAAILTITGYSVNDTIVVFDRVRENQRVMRREPLDQIVNKSVNQTLGRTIITSGVTFLAVMALYVFGGEVLRGFAFTMLIGVITGTYSTVFIAAAIAIILSRRGPTAAGALAPRAPGTPASTSAPPKAKRA